MSIKEVLTEYVDFVKPMFEDFIWPVSISFVTLGSNTKSFLLDQEVC